MTDLFHIALNGWIIQDGNYPDMRVGDTVRFALEFYRKSEWQPSNDRQARLRHLSDAEYDAAWKVSLLRPSAMIINVGILAFQQTQALAPFAEGSWYEGVICLGVDPFFYFESLAKCDWMPALIYTWAIREIIRDTTPRILVDHPSVPGINKQAWVRDASRRSSVAVPATDAWNHEDADYVLVCERLPHEPTRRL
jgi:hypothetical protein